MNRAEILQAWEALYNTIPPPLAEDEKTIAMIALEAGIDTKTAKRKVLQWVKEGRLECVGLRRTRGPECEAYRVVNTRST